MKTGRPISTPQRSCCAAGDMLIESALRKVELKLSRGGMIDSRRLAEAEKILRTFAHEIERAVSTGTPAGIAVAALVRNSCGERIERAAEFAAKAAWERQDIAVEELRCASAPMTSALAHYAGETEKGEEDEFSTF